MDGTNWPDWEVQMNILTSYCDIDKYVKGTLPHPDPQVVDPIAANNWDHDDKYAMLILHLNITQALLIHVNQSKTSSQMWQTLQAVFETHNKGTAISYQHILFECWARN